VKKLVVDIEKCYKCPFGKCTAKCSYFYHSSDVMHIPVENNGVERLLARAAQYLVCRRCEEPFCVTSCPNEALEKDGNGILQRYSMRCTSCKTCSIACPFGVITLDILDYKSSMCDFCIGRANGKPPLCVETCPEKALEYIEIEEEKGKNIYLLSDNLAIRGLLWNKEMEIPFHKLNDRFKYKRVNP